MSVNPIFDFNTLTQTSTLQLYVDNILVTEYDYNAGTVTLEERLNVDILTLPQLRENLDNIIKWYNFLTQILNTSNPVLDKFNDDIKKKNNQVKADYSCNNIVVTDAAFSSITKLFTFQPRAQIVFNFSDFNNWKNFLNKFYGYSVSF